MRAVLPSLLLVACVHQRVLVHPVEVAHASGELHALAMRDRVTTQLPSGEPVELTVGELLEDCPPGNFPLDDVTHRAYPKCKLLAIAPHQLVVEDHRQLSHAAKTVAVLAVIGSFGVCAWKCPEPANYVAGGTLVLAGTTVVIGAAALMYVALRMSHD